MMLYVLYMFQIAGIKWNFICMNPPTCLEDLISDGEACSVGLVVRHELDEELVSRGDDRRRGDLPAVLPHQLTAVVHAISHLDVIISGQEEERQRQSQCACSLCFPVLLKSYLSWELEHHSYVVYTVQVCHSHTHTCIHICRSTPTEQQNILCR